MSIPPDAGQHAATLFSTDDHKEYELRLFKNPKIAILKQQYLR